MQETLDELATDPRTLHLAASLAARRATAGDARLLSSSTSSRRSSRSAATRASGAAFFANLLYAASVPRRRSGVVLTMRADFYHRCGAYPELAQQLAAHAVPRQPDEPDGLRQAIEEPARRVGLALEPGLARRSSTTSPSSRRAAAARARLLELWSGVRRGGMLTLAGYQESGGVEGAIAKRAEHVFRALDAGASRRSRAGRCCD